MVAVLVVMMAVVMVETRVDEKVPLLVVCSAVERVDLRDYLTRTKHGRSDVKNEDILKKDGNGCLKL